jgi:hypothetical protein
MSTPEHNVRITLPLTKGNGEFVQAWCTCGWRGQLRKNDQRAMMDGWDHRTASTTTEEVAP